MASVTQRGKTWSVRYRVTDDAGNETMKRISGFATKEEAWEQARALERKSNAGIDVHGDTMTCGQLMERWFDEHCRPHVAATTLSKYSDGIDRLSLMPIYSLQIRRINAQTQTRLIDALCSGEYTGRPITVRTAKSLIEPLRLSLSWACKNGYIPVNPLVSAQLPATPKRRQRILNQQDVNDLCAAAEGKMFEVPLLLALYGGLRREEAAGLRWENVDFDRGTITIIDATARATNGRSVEKGTKNDNSRRTISMPGFIMVKLRAAPKRSAYVCASDTGTPYAPSSYPQAIRRLIEGINKQRAGGTVPPMPRATYHDLRHTHAAMLIRLNTQPKVIQERLGHASIKITMDTYGYLMSGLQEEVAKDLDKLYAAAPK